LRDDVAVGVAKGDDVAEFVGVEDGWPGSPFLYP
jgi:hypothetical protein